MLRYGDSVITGLSGGADSCALLCLLVSLRDSMGLKIYACHVNHCIRGEEADKDENFTVELCKKLDVKLFTLRIDVVKEAQLRGIGTEQCGREIRYSFFEEKAKELGAKIATAHTASDNAETVIFNMTRGSGIKGLCGIPPVRGNIIRPLIEASRADTEAYCRQNGIDYMTDSSNLERIYNRNKIRLDVIPVLKEINPSLEKTLSGLSFRLRETSSYIHDTASAALKNAGTENGYSCDMIRDMPPVIFAEAVRILCTKFDIIPEAKHIELIRKIVYNNGAVEIKNGVFAVCSQNSFRIIKKTEQDEITPCSEIPLETDKTISINNKKIQTYLINTEDFHNRKKNEKFVFNNLLDYDTIPLSSVFRTRRSGDVFSPANRNVTKSVKKLFIEMKLPREKRDGLLMLAKGSEILWIEGAGVSEKHKIIDNTKRILVIRIE